MSLSVHSIGISPVSPITPVEQVNKVYAVSGVRLGAQAQQSRNTRLSNKPVAYIMTEAPKQFIRAARDKNVGAYRAALENSTSKDGVNAINIFAMDSAVRDLKRSGAEESGYIAKYMDKLGREMGKFMSGERYGAMSWMSDSTENINTQPLRDEQETANPERTTEENKTNTKDNAADTTKKTGETANGTPESKTENRWNFSADTALPRPVITGSPSMNDKAASNILGAK